ncbi:MAG: hypothetical protein JXR05_02170 [Flavobacteriaceae bacterium]
MDQTTLTIIFGVFGTVGVLFGIYKHYSTLKISKLMLDIKEISEFSLPEEFYKDIPSIPVMIEIKNRGNKSSSNLILTLDFKSKLVSNRIDSVEKISVEESETKLILRADNLNPSERINIYVYCENNSKPTERILKSSNLTQSEGTVSTKESILKQQEIIDSLLESFPFGIISAFIKSKR